MPKNYFYCVIFGAALVFSAAFPFVFIQTSRILDAGSLYVTNLYMTAVILIYIVAFMVLIQSPLYHQLIVFGLVFNYGSCFYMLVNFAIAFCPEEIAVVRHNLYQPIDLAVFLLLTMLSFPLVWRFLRRAVRGCLKELTGSPIPHTLFFIPILSILYSIFITFINLVGDAMRDMFTLPAFLFCTVCLIFAYWFLFSEIHNVKERIICANQLEIFDIQYKKITADVEASRQARHDLRHHLRVLRVLLEEDKIRDAQNYLERTERLYIHRENQNFCGNSMLNALLQYYAAQAEQNGVAFQTSIAIEKSSIEATDMTVLLGNCLENALESCKRIKREKPYITLKMKQVNHALIIQMENTCESVSLRSRERHCIKALRGSEFMSQKTSGIGVGLISVNRIAKKYKGVAEYRFEPPRFFTRIALEMSGTGDVPKEKES